MTMNNEDRVAFINGIRQVLQEFIIENAPYGGIHP